MHQEIETIQRPKSYFYSYKEVQILQKINKD